MYITHVGTSPLLLKDCKVWTMPLSREVSLSYNTHDRPPLVIASYDNPGILTGIPRYCIIGKLLTILYKVTLPLPPPPSQPPPTQHAPPPQRRRKTKPSSIDSYCRLATCSYQNVNLAVEAISHRFLHIYTKKLAVAKICIT